MNANSEESDHPICEDKVGYRCPPIATRFKKGQSGNPTGRPKGALSVSTVLSRSLQEKVVINENGVRKTITKLEAAIKQLVNKAASGELRALRQLVELARDAEAKKEVTETQKARIGDLDKEVIEGILKRFQGDTERKYE